MKCKTSGQRHFKYGLAEPEMQRINLAYKKISAYMLVKKVCVSCMHYFKFYTYVSRECMHFSIIHALLYGHIKVDWKFSYCK